LMNISSVKHPYLQNNTLGAQTNELYGRVLSLLCGYPYPYSPQERPEALSHLDPVRVVRFLRLSMKKLKAGVQELKVGKKTNGLDGHPDQKPHDPQYTPLQLLTADQIRFAKSPIVQHVIRALMDGSEEEQRQIETQVESWYSRASSVETPVNQKALALLLVEFLASRAYDQNTHKVAAEANAKLLENQLIWLMQMREQLRKLLVVLEASPNPIIAAMLESVETGVKAITTQIPKFSVSSADADTIVKEVHKISDVAIGAGPPVDASHFEGDVDEDAIEMMNKYL